MRYVLFIAESLLVSTWELRHLLDSTRIKSRILSRPVPPVNTSIGNTELKSFGIC